MYSGINASMSFFDSFQDGLTRDRARAMRLCLAGFATLWLALLGLLIYLTTPVITREWPDLFTGQLTQLTEIVFGYYSALEPVIIVMLLILLGMWPYVTLRSPRAFANALLNAIAARDTNVSRMLTSTVTAGEEASEALTLEGLAHPLGASGVNWGPVYVILGCVLLALNVITLFESISTANLIISDPTSMGTISGPISAFSEVFPPILAAPLSLLMFALGAILWRLHHIARQGFTCTVNDAGLVIRRTRGQPHERRILWSETRGFAQVIYDQRSALPVHAYILDGTSERFIWMAPPVSEEEEKNQSGLAWNQQDSARRLIALVQRHTNLPLLDISEAVNAPIGGNATTSWGMAERALTVALASGDRDFARDLLARLRPAGPFSRVPRGLARFYIWWSVRKLEPDARERLLATTRALLPYYPYPAKPDAPVPQPLPLARRFLSASWLTLRQIALVALVFACFDPLWSGLTIVNPLYSHALEVVAPAHVLSEQPLYFAALTTPAPGWGTRSASKTDLRTTRFTPQGYELSVRQTPILTQSNFEWNPSIQMPSNGAIIVTVSVSPAVGGGSDSPAQETTAGVLFDGNASGTHGTLFDVDSYGDWMLMHCDNLNSPDLACPDILAMTDDSSFSKASPAPRPGGTTTFHLLLIRQGRTYLLYANGAFLTAYHDDTGPAAPSGAIGLYLDEFGQSARFTNLAVYPVPAGLPFWAQ